MSKKPKRIRPLHLPLVEAFKDTPWFEVKGHEKLPAGKLPKFTGALQTPIVQSLADQSVTDEVSHIDEVMSNILRQRIDKLILLLKHYKLENQHDPWLLLSLRLACVIVPGLRVLREAPRGRGRPKGSKKWTAEARDELIEAVEAVQTERGQRGIANSIHILKKREPYRWGSLNEARYYEAIRDRRIHNQVLRALTKPEKIGKERDDAAVCDGPRAARMANNKTA
jgi:hypothetical protein